MTMKKNLALGVAAVALFGFGAQAHAQDNTQNYSKGDARMLDEARNIEPMSTESREQMAQRQMTRDVADIEPAAGNMDSPFTDFTGIYGGADIGYSFTDDLEGMDGGLFVGYGFEHEFDLLGAYAGIELGYEWSGADGDENNLSYEKDHAWVVTLRPGVSIMSDGLGYGIIGYSRSEFETTSGDEDSDGLILGLGAAFNTNTAFQPRIEYTYTMHEDISTNNQSIEPDENNITLGAVFQY
ncbi:MAG: outer membrane protein [Alphaproteobacteria bacterium]